MLIIILLSIPRLCFSYTFNDVEIGIKVIFISEAERGDYLQSALTAMIFYNGVGCDWGHKTETAIRLAV
jgi:hypothetical protein